MKIIGITGGIGAGKSTILNILREEHEAYILEADRIAHRLMEPGQSAYQKIVSRFTDRILAPDGTIDRKKMAETVFSDPVQLEELNGIVHPEVKHDILSVIEQERRQGRIKLLVIEAALLIEDGYKEICDEMWYVYTSQEMRIRRLMNSRGYSREKCEAVMRQQSSEAFYRGNCDAVIENNGDLTETREQITHLLKNL